MIYYKSPLLKKLVKKGVKIQILYINHNNLHKNVVANSQCEGWYCVSFASYFILDHLHLKSCSMLKQLLIFAFIVTKVLKPLHNELCQL